MKVMHRLLDRQLKRFRGRTDDIPAEWQSFVDAVNDAYYESDVDREMAERSLELSSQELLHKNSEMRAIIQAIPDLLLRIDRDGTTLSFKTNEIAEALREPGARKGQHIQNYLQDNLAGKLCEVMDRFKLNDSVVSFEFAIAGPGDEQWYEARLSPLPNEQAIAVIRNITERKRAERLQSALYRISGAANTAGSLDDLFASVHKVLGELMPARNFFIATYDAARKLLFFPYHTDEFDNDWSPTSPEKSLCGYVLRTGKSLLITPEVFKQMRDAGEIELYRRRSIDWLGVPLKLEHGEAIGVIVIQTYHDNVRLSENDTSVLEYVSTQVASAIQRKRAAADLERSHSLLEATLESTADGLLVVDMNGTITRFNRKFVELWQIPREILDTRDDDKALSFVSRQLAEPETFASKVEELYAHPEQDSSDILEFKDGRIFERYSCPQYVSNQIVGRVWSFRDVTARRRAENKIKDLIHEKELILKEVHHRIKNNMNIVRSMLALQADEQDTPAARDVLVEAGGRVRSMMILYDKLYRSERSTDLSIREYIPPLLHQILDNFPKKTSVRIDAQIEDVVLSANTLSSIGIVLNELMTNTMKYAFAGRSNGLITVTATRRDSLITISFGDNGVGLPESLSFEQSTGFGLRLVQMLVKQIEGTLTVERDNGARFIIEFTE